MAKKSKLLAALDEHQGRDYELEKQKKLQKQAAKRKRARRESQPAAEAEVVEHEEEAQADLSVDGVNDTNGTTHEVKDKSEVVAVLDVHKGRDDGSEKQKKSPKQAAKRKKARPQSQPAAEAEVEGGEKAEAGSLVDGVNGTNGTNHEIEDKSEVSAALDVHKGRDDGSEKQKKSPKQAAKRKKARPQSQPAVETEVEKEEEIQADIPVNGANHGLEDESEGWESDESEDAVSQTVDVAGINDSDSESSSSLDQTPSDQHQTLTASAGSAHQEEVGGGATKEGTGADEIEEQEDDEDEDEDEDAIPFSDIESLSSAERADIIPHQRLTINNTAALRRALKSIALPLSDMPFSEHQALTASEVIPIPDINDDLTRELAFYKQCLDAATRGRALLVKEGVSFSRPADYFAEMVKTDEHMGKIRQKMTDEEAGKRAAAEARKQRDLKRFGKQVQVAKLQERDKAKRDTLDKINLLKRKRRNTETAPSAENEDDLFDIALDHAADNSHKNPARSARFNAKSENPRTTKRQKKDSQFGFGGKKRFSKSGDAISSGDVSGFSNRDKGKGARGTRGGGGGGGGGGEGTRGPGGPRGGRSSSMRGEQRKGGGSSGSKPRLGKSRRAQMG